MENITKKFKFEIGNRIFYLDQLRALAIIGVISIHVSAAFLVRLDPNNINWLIADFFNVVGRFAVPVFLMLTGVLLLNRDYNILEFFKKRYPRILIPFIFWGIVYVIFAFIFQDRAIYFTSLSTALPFVSNIFLGVKGYLTHFWYVWLILSIYLIMPIINKWIRNSSIREIEYFLGIWIITSLFGSFNIPTFNLDLTYFTGPIGFVILGYYLANKKNKILENIWLWLLLFIISTITRILIVYSLSLSVDRLLMGVDTYHILSVIQGASMFLFIKNFNDKGLFKKISIFLKNGIVGRLTVSLSRYSYGIYLMHMLFLSSLPVIGLDFATKSAIKWIPLLIILILILSWGTLAVLNRIPIVNKITGMH